MGEGVEANVPGTTIGFPALVALLEQVFLKQGASGTVAAVLAANCAAAERDGAHSHGVFRIPGYRSTIASGWVDPAAVPKVEDIASGYVAVDAANGFAQPALEAAKPLLLHEARTAGIAVLAIRNSHHFAALWPDVEPFAEAGLIALTVVNSMTCVVPHSGQRPVFGTNPIAFAAPCAGRPPLVFDMATSALAHGDVQIAARESHGLPAGAGVDSLGRATTDPQAVLDGGALLPFGGHKGSALSMMIELLAAGLTGGNFSFEFDWADHPGAQTPWTGQLVIVIDPAHSGGLPFRDRAQVLVSRMADAGVTRLAGERRYQNRDHALRHGIVLGQERLAQLRQWAQG